MQARSYSLAQKASIEFGIEYARVPRTNLVGSLVKARLNLF